MLFGTANNESYKKVGDARSFSNDFYDEPLKLAKFFLNHPCAAQESNYIDSWNALCQNDHSLKPRTNINILIEDLLKRAKIKDLPENDIRSYM